MNTYDYKPPQIEIIRPAMETNNVNHSPMNSIDKDGNKNPMLVCLINDKIIEKAKLTPVTNPIPFNQGNIPTDDGVYSRTIFGETSDERKRNISYIDLKKKFINPYVYEVIKKLYRKIDIICSGQSSFKIVDGDIIEILKDSEDYDETATGIDWFIKNYDKIDFTFKKESKSISRKDKLEFLANLTKEDIFISKWPVIPVFYRDVMEKGGRIAISDISKLYNKIISLTMGLDDSPFDFMNNRQMYAIQCLLIEMRQLGGDFIRGKHGKLRKSILGKSIDRGSGDVISQMPLIDFERPDDCNVDVFHTGEPLSKCLVLGYDFVLKYCLDFFENQFKDRKHISVYGKDGELLRTVPIKNQLNIYTKEHITKMMAQYINTPSMRFDPIPIYTEDPNQKLNMVLSGQFKSRSMKDIEDDPDVSSISTRPMTWTDLFYIAAYDTLSDKALYITRFPTTQINSTVPTLCEPLATIKTIPAVINGIAYKNYPVVDMSIPKDQIVTLFIDTQCISDLLLDVMGGDYDGDKTQSKMAFSVEANEEAKQIMESIFNFIDVSGSLMRKFGHESVLCFYYMTKY